MNESTSNTDTTTMRAIRQEEFGGPEVLREVTVPRPVPDVGEIRIAVRAAGVNPTDCRHRAGGLFLKRLPLTLGWDVSGVVESVGLGVTLFRPGDEVFGMLPYPYGVGSHAQYVVGPARSFARKPAGLDHVQAAAADEAEREAGQGGRVRTIAVQADHAGIKAIADLAASGALRPHIEATFPLAKATEAHTLLENGQTAGKIVLVVEHRNTDRPHRRGAGAGRPAPAEPPPHNPAPRTLAAAVHPARTATTLRSHASTLC